VKVKPSALVAELNGSTAELTAASWKGINYVRRKVTPANPNSAAQQAVRNSLTRCVALWRSLSTTVKTWLDTYGNNYAMSGFNVFTSKNRALEQVPSALYPVPANPNYPVPSTFAAVTGAGDAGDIDVTWVDDAPTGVTLTVIIARDDSGSVFETEVTSSKATAAKTLTGLDDAKTYDVYGWWRDATLNIEGTPASVLTVAPKAA